MNWVGVKFIDRGIPLFKFKIIQMAMNCVMGVSVGVSSFWIASSNVIDDVDLQVQQRDVPGIDAAYLAMDTEEGVEVVWNEVRFSERKNFKVQEEKISQVFDNLIQLEHPNIVKFHKYWIDSRDDKPRVALSYAPIST